MKGLQRWLAAGAIAAQVIFTLGWAIGSAVQGGGYSSARHNISDLGALTADHPWIILVAQGVSGALTIAFVLVPLRRSLLVAGRWEPISAWLLAAGTLGLDNLGDAFFRLDCRAADPGCTEAASKISVHGQIHDILGVATTLVMVVVPFALAWRFRNVPRWRGWAGPAIGFGVLLALALVAYVVFEGDVGQGYAQRADRIVACLGVVLLAARLLRDATRHPGVTPAPMPGQPA